MHIGNECDYSVDSNCNESDVYIRLMVMGCGLQVIPKNKIAPSLNSYLRNDKTRSDHCNDRSLFSLSFFAVMTVVAGIAIGG